MQFCRQNNILLSYQWKKSQNCHKIWSGAENIKGHINISYFASITGPWIGVVDGALSWFRVKIGDTYSGDTYSVLLFYVAQGLVLGPPTFKIYIRFFYKYVEAITIIKEESLNHMQRNGWKFSLETQ